MTDGWCNHLKEGDIFLHKMSEDFVLIFRDGGLLGLGSDGGMIDYDFIPDYKSVTVFGNGCEFRVTAEMHDGYLKAYNAMKKQEGEGMTETRTVYLVKELVLPDCNYSRIHKVFAREESALEYLDELRNPKIGVEKYPERFIVLPQEVVQ